MKVMIAAGGTGGHIYPALALADVLKKKDAENESIFFGSLERMEARVIPEAGYRFYGLKIRSTSGGVKAKAQSFIDMLQAKRQAVQILKKEKPDICVGFGNYISVPLILAAKKLHIPTMIHEQNSFAGKANRFLAPKVDAIVSCYSSNLEQMPKEKQKVLGNPEATLAADAAFDPQQLVRIGLDPDKPFVLFMMGSLGSSSVSEVIDKACPLFADDFQVVIAKGAGNEYEYVFKDTDRIKIVPFVNGKSMLKGCALAVLRAGATTMAEVGAIGCASILIPSPYVPNNHQYFNAMELVKKDAAVLLEEKDLNPSSLADRVNRLMADDKKRQEMKENAYACGKRDAAYEMIDWMEKIVNHG